MALGKHQKTQQGRLRKERGDSQAKNLAKDYPEFKRVPGNTRLDTLEKKFGVSGVNQVRKALKRQAG
jgi:hypothetical protein